MHPVEQIDPDHGAVSSGRGLPLRGEVFLAEEHRAEILPEGVDLVRFELRRRGGTTGTEDGLKAWKTVHAQPKF